MTNSGSPTPYHRHQRHTDDALLAAFGPAFVVAPPVASAPPVTPDPATDRARETVARLIGVPVGAVDSTLSLLLAAFGPQAVFGALLITEMVEAGMPEPFAEMIAEEVIARRFGPRGV